MIDNLDYYRGFIAGSIVIDITGGSRLWTFDESNSRSSLPPII